MQVNNEAMKQAILAYLKAHTDELTAVSDAIWDTPETDFHEDRSSAKLRRLLAENGFRVENGLDGMPTAFRAEYGSGRPVIGFLAEFDALSGMSQAAGVAEKRPLCAGGAGHGCGHNLLGTGAAAAAMAAAELIRQGKAHGTVVCYGCPAEETGSAKAFLVRDGYFRELDAALTWHPWDYNGPWPGGGSLAHVKLRFCFSGRSAHAASCPELGRSALDALELMNMGVQFLREHVPEDTRIHYAITDAGGSAANVVQAHAESVYLVRSMHASRLEEIYHRVIDCAKGAALMTGTQVAVDFIKASADVLPNDCLQRLAAEQMAAIGTPEYTADELALAQALHAVLEAPEETLRKVSRPCDARTKAALLAQQGQPLYRMLVPYVPSDAPLVNISTDVGDVSHVVPTAVIATAAWAADTPAHSWQAVAIGKSGIAHKAMLYAAASLALTAAMLLTDAETLTAAQTELKKRLAVEPFASLIPEDVKPKI